MGQSSSPRVDWVSGAFGFGDDLAYFRGVLGGFARRFPSGRVLVREGYPVERYPELPLEPSLRFWQRRRDRLLDGVVYTGNLRVPTARTFTRLLRRPADVAIIVEFTPTAMVTAAAAHLRRRRVVQLLESVPTFRGGADGRLARAVKGALARRSHVVLVSNPATARYAVEHLGVRPGRLLTGAYLTSAPVSGSTEAADEGGPVRFLFVNSLQERKGLDLLLSALETATGDAAREWTLDVVGDGPARAHLEARAEVPGLRGRVRFHGHVAHEQVGSYYVGAHVVVCPTRGDYRSLAGFEAVNAGRPAILSSRDGAAEEIAEACPAVDVVDPLDRDAFAAALGAYLADGDHLATRLALAARVPARFGMEAVADNLALAVHAAVRRP